MSNRSGQEADRTAEIQAELDRMTELRQHGCECSDDDACQFARERDAARAEVSRLTEENRRLRLQYADACAALRETGGGPWAR